MYSYVSGGGRRVLWAREAEVSERGPKAAEIQGFLRAHQDPGAPLRPEASMQFEVHRIILQLCI